MMVTFKRLNDEISNGEPNRSPPVRVAAKHVAVTLSRNIAHDFVLALDMQGKGMLFMKSGERPDPIRRKKLTFIE